MFHAAITVKPRVSAKPRFVAKHAAKQGIKQASKEETAAASIRAVVPRARVIPEADVVAPVAALTAMKVVTAVTAVEGADTDDAQADSTDGRDIAALYERHAPAIYAHCRRLLGSGPAGRDALQESFVRVLQHHRVLGPGDQALRYLYRTSTNVCINLLRQRSVRERAAPLIAAQINAAQSNQPVPGDREFVRMLLDQCDETAVAVALMHFIDGMTQVEVAATLGITRRTVYNRIRKIERMAADMLEPNLPADEDDVALSQTAP